MRKIATAFVAAALVLGGGTAAHAEDDAPVSEDTTLQEYLDSLSPAERDEFIATQLPATTDVEVGGQQPEDFTAVRSLLAARASSLSMTTSASGCWSQRWTWAPKAAAGNTLYTYYHVGHWCASGSSVTSAKISDHGGETSTPGWSYSGVVGSGRGVVSNEGRSYTRHKFVLKIGGITLQTSTPCARVKGRSSGSSTADSVCGIS
ncbi:hypothetical protein [Cellulomonas palmilytica]|uniref:hypothetical protein n=1 Tax=Cellulomonas palmilytica TaxID=2608402 RepID=UPI001F234C82|nr:hypothetical protein [Cellulomonas palmilytica]UJP41101.1 hypothetical protein F1D97_06520 [Cellulomonas palmilytica]